MFYLCNLNFWHITLRRKRLRSIVKTTEIDKFSAAVGALHVLNIWSKRAGSKTTTGRRRRPLTSDQLEVASLRCVLPFQILSPHTLCLSCTKVALFYRNTGCGAHYLLQWLQKTVSTLSFVLCSNSGVQKRVFYLSFLKSSIWVRN